MLQRLWKSQFKSTGKLDYRIYIQLLKSSLDYEDYMEYGKALVGYMTVCSQYKKAIMGYWDQAFKKK
jgi:hypothetical protein